MRCALWLQLEEDSVMRQAAADILSSVVEYCPSVVREYCLQEASQSGLFACTSTSASTSVSFLGFGRSALAVRRSAGTNAGTTSGTLGTSPGTLGTLGSGSTGMAAQGGPLGTLPGGTGTGGAGGAAGSGAGTGAQGIAGSIVASASNGDASRLSGTFDVTTGEEILDENHLFLNVVIQQIFNDPDPELGFLFLRF